MSTLIAELISFENNFAEVQSEVIEKPYGRIFYDVTNPLSYDSNHAYIRENVAFESAVQDVVKAYQSLSLPTRIYTFTKQQSKVGTYLTSNGFQHAVEKQSFFVQKEPKRIDVKTTLYFERIFTVDVSIDELFASDPQQGEWGLKSLYQAIANPDFFLIGGYEEGSLVCIASLYRRGNLSRINDVFTNKKRRGHGFASQLINYITDFNRRDLGTVSYLYSTVPEAIHVYKKAGYEEIQSMIRGYYWLG